MSSEYEALARATHDIEAEIQRSTPGGYADGLAAAAAINRAHMAGLARTRTYGIHGYPGGGGDNGGDDRPPSPPSPGGGGGRVIEADYSVVPEHKERVSLPRSSSP